MCDLRYKLMIMKFLLSLVLLISTTIDVVALNPSRTYKQRPEKYNMAYEESRVQTNDGKSDLVVWTFRSVKQKADILLVLHNGEGNMADYLRRADSFIQDFTVVMFDYRGYGESSEFEIDNNMYIYSEFQDDTETMIDYCFQNTQGTVNIYGWGIGGGLALGVGCMQEGVAKIVADTPYLGLEDMANRLNSPASEILFPNDWISTMDPNNALNAAKKRIGGVKLIIGSNDPFMNVEDMQTLRKISKAVDKEIHIVSNPDNRDNFRVDKKGYYAVMSGFILD